MNRQKKKVNHSSDEDEQVSIFDSQQQETKEKKSNLKNQNHKIQKKAPLGRPAKNKPKKITVKSREKKLIKDEDDIMKKLMGNRQEQRSKQSTQSQKKDADEIRLDESNLILKKEYTYNNNNEWKEESNPYQEIPLMDEYSLSKDNPSQPYDNKNQEYSQKINLASPNTPSYKYTNPYSNSYCQQQYLSPYYLPQQTYNYYGYSNPYQAYSRLPQNFYPNIDPAIELTFDDFQQITFQDDKINDIDIGQIEQLKQQVNQDKKIEEVSNQTKKDEKYRKRRMSYILNQIEKFRKQYIQLQDLAAQKCENHLQKPVSVNFLLKQWKYDPNLLKKPLKSRQQISEQKTAQEGIPKSKTQGRIRMLNELLTQNPFLTQVEMADVLRAMDPVMNARIERSVVLRLLKMCGFKKKKVRGVSKERNTTLSISLRCEYAHKYREFAAQNFEVFYFDELIINEYFDKQSGWCKAEDEIEFKPQRFIDRSVVVLCLMSSKGVCKYHARFGNYQPQEYCKNFNNMLRNVEGSHQKRLLIINPLPYRDPKPIIQILDKRAWQMLVLPSDGLGLNPLQSYFGDMRDLMKRKRYDTVQTLFESVVEVLQDVEKQGLAQKMLGRVEIYVQKAVHRELL